MVQAVGIPSSWCSLTSPRGRRALTGVWTCGFTHRQKPIRLVQRQTPCFIQSYKNIRAQSHENISLKERPAAGFDDKAPGRALRHTIPGKYVVYDAGVRFRTNEHRGAGIVMDLAAEHRRGRTLSEVDACPRRPDNFDVDNRQVAARYADAYSKRGCRITDNSEARQFCIPYAVGDDGGHVISVGSGAGKSNGRPARDTTRDAYSVFEKQALAVFAGFHYY